MGCEASVFQQAVNIKQLQRRPAERSAKPPKKSRNVQKMIICIAGGVFRMNRFSTTLTVFGEHQVPSGSFATFRDLSGEHFCLGKLDVEGAEPWLSVLVGPCLRKQLR